MANIPKMQSGTNRGNFTTFLNNITKTAEKNGGKLVINKNLNIKPTEKTNNSGEIRIFSTINQTIEGQNCCLIKHDRYPDKFREIYILFPKDKLGRINFKKDIINSEKIIGYYIYYPPISSTVSGPSSTVSGPSSTVSGPSSTVSGPSSTVSGGWSPFGDKSARVSPRQQNPISQASNNIDRRSIIYYTNSDKLDFIKESFFFNMQILKKPVFVLVPRKGSILEENKMLKKYRNTTFKFTDNKFIVFKNKEDLTKKISIGFIELGNEAINNLKNQIISKNNASSDELNNFTGLNDQNFTGEINAKIDIFNKEIITKKGALELEKSGRDAKYQGIIDKIDKKKEELRKRNVDEKEFEYAASNSFIDKKRKTNAKNLVINEIEELKKELNETKRTDIENDTKKYAEIEKLQKDITDLNNKKKDLYKFNNSQQKKLQESAASELKIKQNANTVTKELDNKNVFFKGKIYFNESYNLIQLLDKFLRDELNTENKKMIGTKNPYHLKFLDNLLKQSNNIIEKMYISDDLFNKYKSLRNYGDDPKNAALNTLKAQVGKEYVVQNEYKVPNPVLDDKKLYIKTTSATPAPAPAPAPAPGPGHTKSITLSGGKKRKHRKH
jgi:hypothetical protein